MYGLEGTEWLRTQGGLERLYCSGHMLDFVRLCRPCRVGTTPETMPAPTKNVAMIVDYRLDEILGPRMSAVKAFRVKRKQAVV